MKLSFHGAARMVTGSKHLLVTPKGTRILMDCGLFQGHDGDTERGNKSFGFDPKKIDFLLVSHAHIDHTGLVPLLIKQGFKGPIYCTPATRDVMEVLLLDSAKIQEGDIYFTNKKRRKQGLEPETPLYETHDVEEVMKLIKTSDYNQPVDLTDEVRFMFTDAGHIIGSASINLTINNGKENCYITYSGDVGRFNHEILRGPQPFPQADYIICESTYGNELHDPTDATDEEFLNHLLYTCVEKKGKMIIPAFSIGRTQEILYMLNNLSLKNKLPKINFYVDSPLSQKATEITQKHTYLYNKQVKKVMERDDDVFDFPGLIYVESAEESKKLNFLEEPCVIISASGMADAGRVQHHIANNIHRPEATVLIVGYCEPNSLGGKLMNGAERVQIHGDDYEVICDVRVMRTLSAHGDFRDLSEYLSCQNIRDVKKVFLVHGDYQEQILFRERLLKIGFQQVEIPDLHSMWELE